MIRLSIILLSIFLMGGCSTSSKNSAVDQTLSKENSALFKNSTVQQSLNKEQSTLFLAQLHKEFHYWQGTPYRFGGNSKKGIDCSALVQHIYLKSFNVKLPRTTEKQVQEGFLVHKSQLQVADLVFFKTGWNIRHVGVYIGNNKFIHASYSKGVITSSLDNVYWKSKYWQAKRILD